MQKICLLLCLTWGVKSNLNDFYFSGMLHDLYNIIELNLDEIHKFRPKTTTKNMSVKPFVFLLLLRLPQPKNLH